MNMTISQSKLFFAFKVAAMAAVFSLLIYHLHGELDNAWIIPVYLVAGYYFGKLTCGTHIKKYGFWITIGLFMILNFVHSLIDGILMINLGAFYRDFAVYSHELIRQPALYIVVWGMLQPFERAQHKILMALLSVTGIWLLGVYIGTMIGNSVAHLTYLDTYFAATIFIFAGDIIHHLIDDYVKLRQPKAITS
jgi:hypothetical protein